jgi:hypothetical protein
MTSPVWVTLNGGASLIRRGGAYAGVEAWSEIGGVVGATVGFRFGSMLGSSSVAAEAHICGTKVEDADLGDLSETQNDVPNRRGASYFPR